MGGISGLRVKVWLVAALGGLRANRCLHFGAGHGGEMLGAKLPVSSELNLSHGMGWDGICGLPDLPGCRRTSGTPVFWFCGRPPMLSSERLCVGRGGISEPMDGIFPSALFCICFPRCSTRYFAKCHQWACWAVDSPPCSPAGWAMGEETLQAHAVEAVIAVIWSGLQRWFPAKQDWFGAERLAGWFH